VTAVTILRRGLDLALAALVAAVVVIGLTAYLTPAVHGRALAIRSGSMEPAIGVGSLAVVMPQDPSTLAVGDVVTISLSGGTVLTHRIHEIVQQDDRRMFRLRGDANPAPDPVLATQDQLLGRVVVAIPWLGYLLALMSMPSGVVGLLSFGGLLLTAAWLVDDVAAEQADRRARRRRTTMIDVGYDVAPEPR
jgi:signal peptidase I